MGLRKRKNPWADFMHKRSSIGRFIGKLSFWRGSLTKCYNSDITTRRLSFAASAKLLVKNARIFSMAPQQRDPFTGYFVVAEDGTLTTVSAGEMAATAEVLHQEVARQI